MSTEQKAQPILKSWLVPFRPMPDASSFVVAFRNEFIERLDHYHQLSPVQKLEAVDDLLKSVWLFIEEQRSCSNFSLSPVETLYGFMGWLTCRKAATTLGAKYDAAPVPVLIERFAKAQGWDLKCRDYWHHQLVRVPETLADVTADQI